MPRLPSSPPEDHGGTEAALGKQHGVEGVPHLPRVVRPQSTIQVQLHQKEGSGSQQHPRHEERIGDEVYDVPEVFYVFHDPVVPERFYFGPY